MKRHLKLTLVLLILSNLVFGQENDNLFERLQALHNSGINLYNVDGIEISSQVVDVEFSPKNISKNFKHIKIKEKDLITTDKELEFRNFYVIKKAPALGDMEADISCYFVETQDKKVIGFTFASINNNLAPAFERKFIRSVRDNAIPARVFNSMNTENINFVGREIALGDGVCRWMNVNNIQCPSFGQMNWSIHKTLESASNTIDNHFTSLKKRKSGKIISDTMVTVVFEGTETMAKKLVYDFKGVPSLLVGISGGKTLTIYMVAAPVRNNFVSCVMSFWNNDYITDSGLAPLLAEVMQLKK